MKIRSWFLIAFMMMFLTGTGMAAEWAEGRSPAQPYSGVRELDLSKVMGYIMFYPKESKAAKNFCDTLQISLPREDVKAGPGMLHLFMNGADIFSTAFNDTNYVEMRALNEEELDGLMWGSGVIFIVHLPSSLQFAGNYYVTMEEGCIINTEETITNPAVIATDAWKPKVEGSYGVEALAYMREGTAVTTSESAESEESNEAATETTTVPTMENVARFRRKGDRVSFRLVLGGEAASAMVYDPDVTINFDSFELTKSGTYTGTVIANQPGYWGIVFLDAQGNYLDLVELGY